MKLKKFKILFYLVAIFLFVNLVFLGYGIFLKGDTPTGSLKVVFFDVGQGDAVLIRDSHSRNILVDGGPDRNIIYHLDQYIPFYDREIDLMVSTHADLDHMTGLVETLRRYRVKKILDNGLKSSSAVGEEWDRLIKEKKIFLQTIDAPLNIVWDEQTILEFIWPWQDLTRDVNGDDNFASLVFKLKHGENDFLFTGDADKEVEKILTESDYDLSAAVLKVGHHGSKYSSSLEFLKAVNPAYGVISVGENSFGHPSLRVLSNLEEVGTKILRTDGKGDVVFVSNGENLILGERREN
ncbi:MAG: MBL fold metallo-hydrolase [Patescibacteria group bacterium]|jgi:competence protein ComEC|nr:MBL fold metallo-hydrolase [Patescibacteria group bacterium]